METRRGGARQEVPDDLARQLCALREVDNPLLNLLLAAARSTGWNTPALAAVLDMKPPAVSKRIERARQRYDDDDTLIAAAAEAGYVIPKPPRVRAMIDGRQLPPAQIAALKGMQVVASRVNGAMPVGHPDRRVSEQFSAELDRLIEQEGYTPYYLAGVLGISHRAITSRLERHRMREPCPSVAGTASGVYYARKIGDPGEGAPRVTRDERAELRALWQAHLDGKRGAKTALAAKLREYAERGFTLANLAQTMSTRDMRVRYGALQVALGGTRELQEA